MNCTGREKYKLMISSVICVLLLSRCGSDDGSSNDTVFVMEETGAIQPGDMRDPNHSDLEYDAFEFQAEMFDTVSIEVEPDSFVPLLKLVEVSTGAVIAEWEAEYSDDEALYYTIAGPGRYEARVYSLNGGSGEYTVTIIVRS